MQNLKFASIYLIVVNTLSCISGSSLPPAQRSKPGETIPVLLRISYRSASVLSPRQSFCLPDEHLCSDDLCCPSDQNCVVLDGLGGCCDIGKECKIPTEACGKKGYLTCAGTTVCCPIADDCERDSKGNILCVDPNGNLDSPAFSTPSTERTTSTLKLPATITATLTSTDTETLPLTSTITATAKTVVSALSTSLLLSFATPTSTKPTFTTATVTTPAFVTASDTMTGVSVAVMSSMASASIVTVAFIADLAILFF